MNNSENGFDSWDNEVYVDNRNYSNYTTGSMSAVDTESKLITRSFIFMFIALLVTTATSVIVAMDFDKMLLVFENFEMFLVLEIAVVIATSVAISKKKAMISGILFATYSVVNGATLSFIFYSYELGSVQNIFLMTAILFGVMAVIGAVTKVRLSSVGGICLMLLHGVIIVTACNGIFIHSQGLELAMCYLGVFIFIGLTAYDTQRLKQTAGMINEEDVNVEAIFWGMDLYLDFINLFLKLLALFGKRK